MLDPGGPSSDPRGPAWLVDKRPDKGLLSLSSEVIDMILQNVHSPGDLKALASTSRVLYSCFKRREPIILKVVLKNCLGPIYPDAHFLARFPPQNLGTPKDDQGQISPPRLLHCWRLFCAWELYKRVKDDYRNGTEAEDLRPDLALLIAMCQMHRTLNYLVVIYIQKQLLSFGTGPAATKTASHTEKSRILRAFYRRQIVANAWLSSLRGYTWEDFDRIAISNTLDTLGIPLGLFANYTHWELQQMEHADDFIANCCAALLIVCPKDKAAPNGLQLSQFEVDAMFESAPRLVCFFYRYPHVAEQVLKIMQRTPLEKHREVISQPPVKCTDNYSLPCFRFGREGYTTEECIFREQGLTLPTLDPQLLTTWPRYFAGRVEQLTWGTMLSHKRGMLSERWEVGRDDPPVAEPFEGDDIDLPPFAWVDARNGIRYDNYGDALDPYPKITPMTVAETYQRSHFRHINGVLWHEAGLSFWDKDRVEALKRSELLEGFETGWMLLRSA